MVPAIRGLHTTRHKLSSRKGHVKWSTESRDSVRAGAALPGDLLKTLIRPGTSVGPSP